MKPAMEIALGFRREDRKRAQNLVLIAQKEGMKMAAALLEGVFGEDLDDSQAIHLVMEWIKEMKGLEVHDDPL